VIARIMRNDCFFIKQGLCHPRFIIKNYKPIDLIVQNYIADMIKIIPLSRGR
jgi:hypothetical protein